MPSSTVLLNSSVLAMRKSLILASFLFSSSSFAISLDCPAADGQLWVQIEGSGGTTTASCDSYPEGTYCAVPNATVYMSTGTYQNIYGMDAGCYWKYSYFNLQTIAGCPSGFIQSGSTCNDPNNYFPPPDDPSRELDQFDGDPSGCDGAGGVYMTSGRCNSTGEAIAEIFQNPEAVVGAMLTIGGIAFAGTGIVALPITGGGSALAVSAGSIATLTGLGMMGVSAMGEIAYNPQNSTPSNDMTVGENRLKVNLSSYSGTSGSSVTSTNSTTGKVESATFVPDSVRSALSDSSNVDTSTGSLINPISLAGIQTTSYDYATNTATTVTHSPTSTSSNPVTSTRTSSFTVTQNLDGSVTTIPTDSTSVPVVSGSGGGSVVSAPSGYSTVAGSSGTGDSPDYGGVLNDIKNNTGDSKSFLEELLAMFEPDESFDPEIDNGTDSFGDLKNEATGSFEGFVYNDPLGLNNSSSGTIPTYSFTLMGQTYVLFDQALFNKLPIDLIKSILLMVAAIAGFITVIAGV
jgi:hypothetical protein